MSGDEAENARLIVIEGIDGSGKGTQTRLLRERLGSAGYSVGSMAFPQYEANRFGAMITRFLAGEFGSLESVAPELASLLFAGDRRESLPALTKLLGECDVVCLDRYVASNIAHQAGRLPEPRRSSLIEFLDWLEHTQNALPRADATIWLDVTPSVAARNIRNRAAGGDRIVDIAEEDEGHLRQSSDVYRQIARRSASWTTVACDDGQAMQPVDAVHEAVWAAVAPLLVAHEP